jgi:outer membrane protein OmpA-like peptidoglycan-associated protein
MALEPIDKTPCRPKVSLLVVAGAALLAATAGSSSLAEDCVEARRLLETAQGLGADADRLPLLERAANLCPDFYTSLNLGETLLRLGRHPEAEAALMEAQGRAGTDAQKWGRVTFRRGQLAMATGKLCEAVPLFAEALPVVGEDLKESVRLAMRDAESRLTADGLSEQEIRCSLTARASARSMRNFIAEVDAEESGVVAIVDVPVYFDFDSAFLTPDGQAQVHALTLALATYVKDDYTIRFIGHTDRRGTREYNRRLSERRAEPIAQFVAQADSLPRDRMVVDGRGFDQLKYPGDDEESHRLDRRVEVELLPP